MGDLKNKPEGRPTMLARIRPHRAHNERKPAAESAQALKIWLRRNTKRRLHQLSFELCEAESGDILGPLPPSGFGTVFPTPHIRPF